MTDAMTRNEGSLTIVGTGIEFAGQLTPAARTWIETADKVLHAVADPLTMHWLQRLNGSAEALPYNTENAYRRQTYRDMVARILAEVRTGADVCAVFYGHPGVLADPAHLAASQARREGYFVQMLPAVSALDCLLCDLGVDPGKHGCQSFEATDFLIRHRRYDPTSILVLWQIAMIGNRGFDSPETRSSQKRGLAVLSEALAVDYGADYEVVVYEAAVFRPIAQPFIERTTFAGLPDVEVTTRSTLYVPPMSARRVDHDMMARLGMIPDDAEPSRRQR